MEASEESAGFPEKWFVGGAVGGKEKESQNQFNQADSQRSGPFAFLDAEVGGKEEESQCSQADPQRSGPFHCNDAVVVGKKKSHKSSAAKQTHREAGLLHFSTLKWEGKQRVTRHRARSSPRSRTSNKIPRQLTRTVLRWRRTDDPE